MTLGAEEVVTTVTTNISEAINKMPYAMMGAVDEGVCCGLRQVNGIMPAWGCSADLVKEISEELQARKVGRGNIAQLRNQENTMYKALELDVRTDLLMRNIGVVYPPTQATMTSIYGASPPRLPSDEAERGSGIHIKASERLDTRSWMVTNCCENLCCQTTQLELDDEEAVTRTTGPCCKNIRREPYAQMGSVEKVETCKVCVNVSTDSATINPNFGCARELVDEIAGELQFRKVTRGNIAQIKQQENMMIEIIKMGVKLDLIASQKGLRYPPTQETMDKVFYSGAQAPSADLIIAGRASRHSFRSSSMEVSIPQGMGNGDMFKVQGPRGSFYATVPDGLTSGDRMQVDVPEGAGNNLPSSGRRSQLETEMAPLARAA